MISGANQDPRTASPFSGIMTKTEFRQIVECWVNPDGVVDAHERLARDVRPFDSVAADKIIGIAKAYREVEDYFRSRREKDVSMPGL